KSCGRVCEWLASGALQARPTPGVPTDLLPDFHKLNLPRAVPGFFKATRRSRLLPRGEYGVFTNLSFQHTGQKPGLNFQQSAIGYTIIEQGVRYHRIHSRLVCPEKTFSSRGCQCYRGTDPDKVLRCDHARVDGAQDSRIADEGPERFHQVQGQGRPSIAW